MEYLALDVNSACVRKSGNEGNPQLATSIHLCYIQLCLGQSNLIGKLAMDTISIYVDLRWINFRAFRELVCIRENKNCEMWSENELVSHTDRVQGSISGHSLLVYMNNLTAIQLLNALAPQETPPLSLPSLAMTISVTRELVKNSNQGSTLRTLCGTGRGVAPLTHAASSTPLPGSVRSYLSQPLTTLRSECADIFRVDMMVLYLLT